MKNDDDLLELKRKIKYARNWAREHFRADRAGDTRIVDDQLNILPPSFFVEFPSPDTMTVNPSVFGKDSTVLKTEYKLAFYRDGRMSWNGKHPFYDTPLPPLFVE